MELSDDQRRRMEENRLEAQAKLRQKRAMQQSQGSGQQSQPANPPGRPEETAPTHKAAGASSPRTPAGSPAVLVGERSCAKTSAELSHNKEYVDSECSAGYASNIIQNSKRRGVAAARGELLLGTTTTSNLPSAQSSRAGGGLPLTGAGSKFRLTAGEGRDSNSAAPTAATECEACQGAEGDARVDQELLQGFGITVCRKCKLSRDEYHLITKKEAKDAYLLPEGTVAVLKFVEKDNPHHTGWTKMKLYLRRDVMEYSFKRWGSEAALEAERRRREASKFDRSLARTKGVFKRAKIEHHDNRRHHSGGDVDE